MKRRERSGGERGREMEVSGERYGKRRREVERGGEKWEMSEKT